MGPPRRGVAPRSRSRATASATAAFLARARAGHSWSTKTVLIEALDIARHIKGFPPPLRGGLGREFLSDGHRSSDHNDRPPLFAPGSQRCFIGADGGPPRRRLTPLPDRLRHARLAASGFGALRRRSDASPGVNTMNDQQSQAVRDLIARYHERFSAGDIESVLELWHERGTVFEPGSQRATGKQQLRAAYERGYTGADYHFVPSIEDVTVGGDLGAVLSTATGTVTAKATG